MPESTYAEHETWRGEPKGKGRRRLGVEAIPIIVFLLIFALMFFAFKSGSPPMIAIAIATMVGSIMVLAAVSAAADGVFRAFLYTYATGKTLPEDIDTDSFGRAFEKK